MDEIALPGEDESPVRHISHCRERITPKRGERVRFGEPSGVGRHEEQEEQEAGKEAARSPLVETEKRHRAGSAPFGDEQRCDEVAGQHEEDIDAEKPATEPGHSGMESEDTDHGHGADAVESGHVLP